MLSVSASKFLYYNNNCLLKDSCKVHNVELNIILNVYVKTEFDDIDSYLFLF